MYFEISMYSNLFMLCIVQNKSKSEVRTQDRKVMPSICRTNEPASASSTLFYYSHKTA